MSEVQNAALTTEFGEHCTVTLQSKLSPLSLECYVWSVGTWALVPVGLINRCLVCGLLGKPMQGALKT